MGEWESFVWEEIDPELVSAINELCGRRRRLSFRCADSDFTLRLDPPSTTEAGAAAVGLHFLVQGMKAWLGLPSLAFLGETDPELAPYWCSEYAGEGELGQIAAEAAWEPFGALLERVGGGRTQLGGFSTAPDPACIVRFFLRATRGESPWLAAPVAVEPRLAGFWGEAARRLPVEKGWPVAGIPVSISLEAGGLLLDLSIFRRLKPGDVVFPEEPFPGNPMIVKMGGIPLGEAELDECEAKSMIRVVPNRNLTGDAGSGKNPDSVSPLDAVPISLSFEVGRRQVPLGELETLKERFLFELDREGRRPLLILANGRAVGTGELVKVGERVGVRVMELRADAAP